MLFTVGPISLLPLFVQMPDLINLIPLCEGEIQRLACFRGQPSQQYLPKDKLAHIHASEAFSSLDY